MSRVVLIMHTLFYKSNLCNIHTQLIFIYVHNNLEYSTLYNHILSSHIHAYLYQYTYYFR